MDQFNFADFYLETVEIEGPSGGRNRVPMDKNTIAVVYRPEKSGCSYVRLSAALENALLGFKSVQIKRNPYTNEIFLFFTRGFEGVSFRYDKTARDRKSKYPIINSVGFTKALLKVCGVEIKKDMPIVRMKITDNLANAPQYFTVKIVNVL